MKRTKTSRILKGLLALLLCLSIVLTNAFTPLTVRAASGNFTGGQICTGYRLKIAYSESEKDPVNNTSKVKAVLYLIQDKSYDLYISTRTATLTIDGTTKKITNIPAIRNTGGVTTKLGSTTVTVKHTSDGSKTVNIAATFDMKATLAGTYYGTMSTSKKITLDTLDRKAPTVTLKCNSVTASSVNMTASANASCDNWQYSKDSGKTWTTFGTSGTSNSFTISNLKGGTKYTIIARARRIYNHVSSSNSSSISATTKPSPPGGLSASEISATSAKFSWSQVTGATSYKVYLDGVQRASGQKGLSYTFTGLEANTKYQFGVCATGSSGDSSISSKSDNLTLPNAPTDVVATDRSDSEVTLNWSYDDGGNAESVIFTIIRDGEVIGTTTDHTYVDTTYGNTDSEYQISAVTSAVQNIEQAPSASVSVSHVPLEIKLQVTGHGTYATITPTFTGGLNREIDETSLRWGYGELDSESLQESGTLFESDFTALQNGIYSVRAADLSGEEAVVMVAVDSIYTESTQGAYTKIFTDLSVDGIGNSITFDRTYNSMDDTEDLFGKGWSLSYAKETYLSKQDNSVRLVHLPDGSIDYFKLKENAYIGIGTQDQLSEDEERRLILTTRDNTKYTYKNDVLISIEDANGNVIRIEVNDEKQPVRIIDSSDREYTISYQNHRVASITDPAGRIFSYVYDDDGNLIEQKGSDGSVVNQCIYEKGLLTKITDGFGNTVCEMSYNSQRRLVNMTDADDNSTYYLYKITSNGEIVVYESDSEIELDLSDVLNNPPSTTYNPYGQVVIDSDGNCYTYNPDGTIGSINIEDTVTIAGDYEKVIYTYDFNGNVTHIVTTDKSDKLLEDITYTYTYFENSSNLLSSFETVIQYTYDDTGTLTETDTETLSTTYDNNGNLLSERTVRDDIDKTETYTYNSKGLLLSEKADDITTEYTYDRYGSITNIKTVENDVETNISMESNVIGQVLTQTENGLTTTYVYDLCGNVIKLTQSDGTVTRITRTVYNSRNQLTQKISDQQYAEADDDICADKNGISSDNIYLNKNVGDRYTYDTKGNVLTYMNKASNKTVNTYDIEDRLVKTVTYENASTTANGLTTRYVYDTDGNLIQTVYPHQYHAENDNLDVSNGVNEYTDHTIGERASYDENGNVFSYIDSFGKETVNTYDSNGNLVKSVSGNETTRFVYNGGDKLLQVIYPNQYNLDDDNLNLSSETPIDTYANANVGDRYTYDDNGNILTYTNQYGEITTNTYDADGNLLSTTKPDGMVFTFDEDDRAKKETYSNGFIRDFTYTSNQTVISGSNGITVTYNLNSLGEVAEYKLQNGENNKEYSYTYDSAGNITTISLNGSLQQTFTYNTSNELVRVDDAVINKTVTYDYDYVGNITSVKTYIYTTGTLGTPLTTQDYTYNSQNQRTDLSYDANGNMTSLNGYTFGWTNRRLTSVISTDNSISYTYNYDGIRTSKTINGITTYYVVDENNNVVKQYELVNDVETNVIEFVYDSNNSPLYFTYNNATYYYEKNMQGDIVAILDTNGNTVIEYAYNIWGELFRIKGELADTIGVINPLRYRGYYYDTETALYYLQSRYYSPDLMRFISQDDPVFSNEQGQPLGSNLYGYCGNDSVNNIDPTGLLRKCWYNKVSNVAKAIDIAIIVITAGKSLVGIKAIRTFLKINRRKIVKNITKKLTKMIGTYAATFLPAAIDVALTLFGTSIGDLIARGLDWVDPLWEKGYVRGNGYILN